MVSNEVIVALDRCLLTCFPLRPTSALLMRMSSISWPAPGGLVFDHGLHRWEGRTFHAGVINMPGAFVGAQPTPAPERFERRQGRLSATALVEFACSAVTRNASRKRKSGSSPGCLLFQDQSDRSQPQASAGRTSRTGRDVVWVYDTSHLVLGGK